MPGLPPASSFPPGYLEEYNGNTLLGIAGLFIGLNTVFATLRYYARRQTTAGTGWDDFIIPMAWLANCGLCVLGITMVYDGGVGRHFISVEMENPTQILSWAKSLYAFGWLYLPSVALPKISILALYLRIFTNNSVRRACYILIAILIANWIAFLFALTFQCSPVAFQWDKKIPGGRCSNISAFYKSTSAPNILTDLVIMVLPIPTIWQLQVSTIRKVGLMFVFLVGSVGIVASCVRMATFFQNDAFVDNTWVSVKLVSWSIVEPSMYLIAACLLTFRPLFSKRPLKWLTSYYRSGATSSSSRNLPAAAAGHNTNIGGDGTGGFDTGTGNGGSGPPLQLSSLRPMSRSHSGFVALDDPPSPVGGVDGHSDPGLRRVGGGDLERGVGVAGS